MPCNATRSALAITALGCAAALALAGCPKPAAPPVVPSPSRSPAAAPTPATVETCGRIVRIDVSKSQRKLVAACASGGQLEYAIALSRATGPKRRQGDLRMPEGEYRIAGPPRASRFHLFIPFDYPSRADAALALAEGRIDRATHDAIVRAHERGRMPPQHTPLGGALGIHGEGPRWRGDLELDWTEGCVAVTDRAIDELANLVRRGTPIRIAP